MFGRIALWAFRSYVGGPARSWVFTSMAMILFRTARSVLGRRELIDLSSVKPGDTLMIEHLPISHKRQIKDMKKEKRNNRRARRQAAKGSTTA